MIRHVFTLIWNRKRANALIMLELLITFLILFALIGFSLNLYRLYDKPLGFNVANTWTVSVASGGAWSTEDDDLFRQVLAAAKQLDEVTAAELMFDLPFDLGGSSMNVTVGKMDRAQVQMNVMTAALPEAIGMQLVEGRWFGPQDETLSPEAENVIPVLVNQAFSDAAGGGVVGKLIPMGPDRQQRIVGVFETYRQHGQFSAIEPFMIQRLRTDGTFFDAPRIVLILKPGVPAEFEERLLGILQRVAPAWDFDVNSWESLQENHFKLYTIPLMVVSGIVLFLMSMVGFGLLGVLWQNIIRRTPEMGVRRAMGATAGAVRLQVVLELLAVAVFTLVLGLIIVVQFPLSGVLQALDWSLFFPSAAASTVVLLGLCVLFALYPSYQATRQDPVEALRYE